MAENYKTVAEFEKVKSRLEVERDNYKDSLDTAQNSLKEFEGVDVKELNGKSHSSPLTLLERCRVSGEYLIWV